MRQVVRLEGPSGGRGNINHEHRGREESDYSFCTFTRSPGKTSDATKGEHVQ